MIEQLPRVARLLEPVGRICELLHATPHIEPPTEPAYHDAATPADLSAILDRCTARAMEEDWTTGPATARPVVAGQAHGAAPTARGPAGRGGGAGQRAACRRNAAPPTTSDAGTAVGDAAALDRAALRPLRAVFSAKLRPDRFRGKIEFRDVHFAYLTELRRPVLQGLSFVVELKPEGRPVGATGCGKSSVLSLLQRLYEPHRGTIMIDDRLEAYDLRHLRSRIVIVDQFTVLFSKTIRDNVTYDLEADATDAEVEHACREAQAWEFIEEKPDKLLAMVASGAPTCRAASGSASPSRAR